MGQDGRADISPIHDQIFLGRQFSLQTGQLVSDFWIDTAGRGGISNLFRADQAGDILPIEEDLLLSLAIAKGYMAVFDLL